MLTLAVLWTLVQDRVQETEFPLVTYVDTSHIKILNKDMIHVDRAPLISKKTHTNTK